MSDVVKIDSGRTLSIKAIPGQDVRYPTTKSDSIFTFGSFRMERNFGNENLSGDSRHIKFNEFSDLTALKTSTIFNPEPIFHVKNNELNLVSKDPNSYSYFSSFYSSIADGINNVINTFPYAILAYDFNTGNTITNFTREISGFTTYSTFRIPYSSCTNQGNVMVNTGSSVDLTLVSNFDLFSINLSGSSSEYDIIEYLYVAPSANTSYLQFKIKGDLFLSSSSTEYANAVYVKPTNKRYNLYLKSLSRLEKQLLIEGEFLIPNATIPNQTDTRTFTWPKTIDGFNPDTSGNDFEDYKDDILSAAELVDDDKTNIMVRTFFPENLIDQDDEFQDMRYLAEVFSKQFDEIKQFIDGIAYAHSINYDQEESVPNKFLVKLSKLFGLQLSDSFNEIDMFEYLVGDVGANSSLSVLNVEIWRRILINIVWLYKKKGTRDALQFIFKLVGAPDCLINLNEFVYEIEKVSTTNYSQPTPENNFNESGPKINENGYINYDASYYIFQEGGQGRGDGQKYINQWTPEFNPIKKVDNIKIATGSTEFFGTQNIINTKEIEVTISPANAIECDVFDWYKVTGVCWNWGTTAYTFAFSALTVPFELLPEDCSKLCNCILTGMSYSQFLDYAYTSFIDPRDRKTSYVGHTSFNYVGLRNLYLYYYYSITPESNRLNFKKMEYYVNLLETQFQEYIVQLIPATTIFHGTGTEYKNTIFNRQKFVYKEGINTGSEFQLEFIPPYESVVDPVILDPSINQQKKSETRIIFVNGRKPTSLNNGITPAIVTSNQFTKLVNSLNPVVVTGTISHFTESSIPYL